MRSYSYKGDRALRAKLRRAKKYPSRASLRNQAKVKTTIRKFSNEFGQYNPSDVSVMDKYYVKEEFPPRDVATETGLGAYLDKSRVCVLVAVGLLLLYFAKA